MGIGRLIGQGRTAEVYEWERNKVVKLYRKEIDSNIIDNEYRTSREIFKMNIPTPEAFNLIRYDNRLGIIYERVYGCTMTKSLLKKPWTLTKGAKRLAEIHRLIQKKIDYGLPSQKDRLKKRIELTNLLRDDIKKKIYNYLDSLPDDNVLCHGDFHTDNVLISGGKVTVIDWMDATVGDPISDIARTSILFRLAEIPEEKSPIERRIIDLIRKKFYSEYIKHYINISGIRLEQIERWELPIIAARLIEDIPDGEKTMLLNYIDKKIVGI